MSSEAIEHASNPSNPFVNFELEKVLSENDRTKYMALLGRYVYVVCAAIASTLQGMLPYAQ